MCDKAVSISWACPYSGHTRHTLTKRFESTAPVEQQLRCLEARLSRCATQPLEIGERELARYQRLGANDADRAAFHARSSLLGTGAVSNWQRGVRYVFHEGQAQGWIAMRGYGLRAAQLHWSAQSVTALLCCCWLMSPSVPGTRLWSLSACGSPSMPVPVGEGPGWQAKLQVFNLTLPRSAGHTLPKALRARLVTL